MALINQANLDVANTAFFTAINEVFSDGVPGVWEQFTTLMPAEGTSVDILVVDGVPRPREWIGPKQFKNLRAYKRNEALRKWEASFALPIDQINGDVSGVVGARIADFVSQAATAFYDSFVVAQLVANPVGYDGVSLLNNTHVNVGTGGTTDNLTTSAVSFAQINTGRQALLDMKDENGKPLNSRPTHLLVGPAQERTAMEVTGSDRPVGIGTGGTVVTSAAVAAERLVNYQGAGISVIVSPEITGNEWFLMDLSKGMRKPFGLAEFQAPEGVVKDQPTDDNVFFNDEVLYSMTAKATPFAGDWHLIYGSVTA